MNIFQTARFDSPPDFRKEVARLMVGMKHTVKKEMQEQGVTCEEGNSPMVFPVFKHLCQLMSASGVV